MHDYWVVLGRKWLVATAKVCVRRESQVVGYLEVMSWGQVTIRNVFPIPIAQLPRTVVAYLEVMSWG